MGMYDEARRIYGDWGVDAEAAIETFRKTPVSVHCWQIDDLSGFENTGKGLSGGIQATGNAPGKPESTDEYFEHLEKAVSLIPGALKIALHAIYPVTCEKTERDSIEPVHFRAWVDWAKAHGTGLDFNPTYFSHPMADSGVTLTSEDENIRQYWIRHGKACRKIGEYFGRELGQVCINNHWIGDGSKDIRIDRTGPRERLADSLDRIFEEEIDRRYLIDSVESKLFGIGVESYTAGSHEFYTNYVANRKNCIICMDTGHFHPTETVSDKLSSYLCFGQEIMLHVSRPVRWDSDHVTLFDDETKAIMQEIVKADALSNVHIGTDYFDASINRIAATVIGARATKKSLLSALLMPWDELKALERNGNLAGRLALLEEVKSMPFGAVWEEVCAREGVPGRNWIKEIR